MQTQTEHIVAREVAPTDPTTQGLTVAILVISVLSVSLMSIALNFKTETALEPSIVFVLIAGIVMVLLSTFVAFINRPLEYILYPNAIEIRRQARKSLLFLLDTQSTEIYQVPIKELDKIWGSSGFFGYFGKFKHKNLGKVDLFCSARTGIALIKSADGWIGISPSNQFLKKFETLSIEQA